MFSYVIKKVSSQRIFTHMIYLKNVYFEMSSAYKKRHGKYWNRAFTLKILSVKRITILISFCIHIKGLRHTQQKVRICFVREIETESIIYYFL